LTDSDKAVHAEFVNKTQHRLPRQICPARGLPAAPRHAVFRPAASSVEADQVWLRPVVEDDMAGLATMLAGLSPDSSYRRFLVGVTTPPPGLLNALVLSRADGAAWLAVAGDQVVAHASWAFEPGTPIAELAAVTADAWQGRGLGTRLLDAVAAEAVQAGASALRLYVLADSRRLVARIGRDWPDATPQRDGPLLVYTIPVAMATADLRLRRSPAAKTFAVPGASTWWDDR
jgi:GNAT superfamily N-acetyltransferase